jgi:hypothetical protein
VNLQRLFYDLPDFSGVLLAAVGGAIIFAPEWIECLKGQRKLRYSIAILLVLLGVLGLVSGHLQRAANDKAQAELNQKVENLQKGQQTTNSGVQQANVGISTIQQEIEAPKTAKGATSPALKESDLLKVYADADLIDYPPGTTGSIKWNNRYTHVLLGLGNTGTTDFTDLDMTVSMDISVSGMDQLTKFPGITMFLTEPPVRIVSAQLNIVDKNTGKVTQVVPAVPGSLSSSGSFRLHCDRILKDSTVKLVIAGVVLNIPNGFSAYEPDSEYGPKKLPTLIKLAGSYKVANQLVNVAKQLPFKPLGQK